MSFIIIVCEIYKWILKITSLLRVVIEEQIIAFHLFKLSFVSPNRVFINYIGAYFPVKFELSVWSLCLTL